MADAALSEQRAHGAVPDQDPRPEQLSQLAPQGKDLSPFWSHIRAEERGCVYSFTSSAGVSSAGVGTCHELASRRLPRLLRARPSTALDERHGPLLGPVTGQLQHDSLGISIRCVYLAGAVRL
jgi:hypothetical protein